MKNGPFNHLIRRRLFLHLFLLLSLFAGAAGPGLAQAEYRLSERNKTELFEEVWNLIDQHYYDPEMNGIDWQRLRGEYRPMIGFTRTDEEFYELIKRMVGEMRDSHTRFLTPREAAEHRQRKGTTVGLLLSRIEGRTVVEKIVPARPGSELARIRPGMTVRTIDGEPVEKRYEEAVREIGGSSSDRALEIIAHKRMLRGEPGTRVRIGLRDERRKRDFEVTLVRRTVEQRSEAIGRILPSGIGYIQVTSFRAPIADKFKKALEELKDTPALIIDLRYNGGGNIREVLKMAGYLINEKRSFGKFIRRAEGKSQSSKSFSAGRNGGQIYANPVVILTSKFSASGSELFSSSLQEFGRARVIGRQTCGCLLGISKKHRFPDGSELHISDTGFLSPKGRIYEKTGVTPDRIVELRIEDLLNGTDREIGEAEKMLTGVTVQTQ